MCSDYEKIGSVDITQTCCMITKYISEALLLFWKLLSLEEYVYIEET